MSDTTKKTRGTTRDGRRVPGADERPAPAAQPPRPTRPTLNFWDALRAAHRAVLEQADKQRQVFATVDDTKAPRCPRHDHGYAARLCTCASVAGREGAR